MNKYLENMPDVGQIVSDENTIADNNNGQSGEDSNKEEDNEQQINNTDQEQDSQFNFFDTLELPLSNPIDDAEVLSGPSAQINCSEQDRVNESQYPKENTNSNKYQQQNNRAPQDISNQWYTLNNRMNQYGTTIEMIYTGQTVPQPQEPLKVQAIPGVTQVTMELPAGVLPNIGTRTPDMPSLINAMEFLRCPELYPPVPGMGPATTIQVIPKSCNNGSDKQIESIDVIPLSCECVAPLKRRSLNLAFQSYSLMQFTVDEGQSQEPGRVVFDADISPTYLLNTHQQLRLQAAIQQDEVPLVDALLPIVNDLCEEHEQLHINGLQLLPAPMPMPYGTMQFHYGQPIPLASPVAVPLLETSLLAEPSQDLDLGQSQCKQRSTTHFASGNQVDLNSTIMALDSNGNYYPMVLSNWGKNKKEQPKF